MNFDFGGEFTFKKAAEYSRDYAQKKSPKASKLLDLITPSTARAYLNLCFTYLRFVDDAVDNPKDSAEKKIKFIEHQQILISHSFAGKFSKPNSIEEACFFYFADYAISNNKPILLEEVKNMVDALGMDAARLASSGIFSKADFGCYVNKMAKSLFNILYNFLVPHSKYLGEEFFIGKFTANAQMIRDLEEDIDAGFINFSEEELEAYKVNLKNIKEDNNFRALLRERTDLVWKVLWEETLMLKDLPFKFRVFTFWSFVYYLTWIIRAKKYGYDLRRMHDKKFAKELNTYFKAFLVSLEIIFKEFIFPSSNDPAGGPFYLFSSAVHTAEIYTRKRAHRLWMLIKVLIPKKAAKFGFLSYSYLKWADDFADNPGTDKHLKKEFIERQLNLLNDLINKHTYEIKNNHEYFLYHFCRCAEKENPEIIFYIKDILQTIKMDIDRLWRNGIFSSAELNSYVQLQTKASFNLVYNALLPERKRDKNIYLGRFLWHVRMMKDFQEDILSGYLNIPLEEIGSYNLNPEDLINDQKLKEWVKHKYSECLEILEDEIHILKSLSSKPKFLFISVYQALFRELIRVKEYDFSLSGIIKKRIAKEIKIFLSSFLMTLKFYYKIFI